MLTFAICMEAIQVCSDYIHVPVMLAWAAMATQPDPPETANLKTKARTTYHHGNLRQALIDATPRC